MKDNEKIIDETKVIDVDEENTVKVEDNFEKEEVEELKEKAVQEQAEFSENAVKVEEILEKEEVKELKENAIKEQATQEKFNSSENAINLNEKDTKEPIKKQKFLKFLILSTITLGIYGIYYFYHLTKDINKLCEGDGKKSPNYIIVFILSIVTLGIYNYYWWYKQASRLYNKGEEEGIEIPDDSLAILLLRIFLPTLGGIASTYMLFDNTNRLASVYNGEITKEQVKVIPDHKGLIALTVIADVVLYLLLFLTFFFGILGLAIASDNSRISIEANNRIKEYIQDKEDDNFAYFFDDEEKKNITLTIENKTNYDFTNIEMKESNETKWNKNIMDKGSVLKKNDKILLPLEIDSFYRDYDFAFLDQNNRIHTITDIDFSKISGNSLILILNMKDDELEYKLIKGKNKKMNNTKAVKPSTY